MELTVDRLWKKADYTIGNFMINGTKFSNTLEDRDRGLDQSMPVSQIQAKKVYGQTAIPAGRYEVTMSYSAKFASRTWAKPYSGRVPEILNVPGFLGIRIHPGSTPADTLGCLLLGWNTKKGMVTSSQDTYRKFIDKHLLPALKKGEKVFITFK